MPECKVEDFVHFASHLSSDYDNTHKVRYLETFNRIAPYIDLSNEILELGGKSPISTFIETCGGKVAEYTQDLRSRFNIDDNIFDSIFLFEVYEHIKDREPDQNDIGSIATFTYSGLINLVSETWRVSKPGGLVFLTTPNATSVDSVARIVKKMPPFGYPPHVREYAPCEVRDVFTQHGFKELEFSTFFAWNPPLGVDRAVYLKLIDDAGGELSDRGDDMFFIFEAIK